MRRHGPLPADWTVDYLEHVDFDRSFAALSGCDHFHAATMRGRIRSLQLEIDAAKNHFKEAVALASQTEDESLTDLKYRFLLNVFRFDHLLLEQPVSQGTALPDSLKSPRVPRVLRAQHPDLRFALNLRDHAHAVLLLHVGDFEEAADMWRALLRDNPDVPADKHIFYHVGLAAALFNHGDRDNALRSAENAGLAVASARRTFHRVHGASLLLALYTFLGEPDEAADWQAFLEHLQCPQLTKDLFLRRADVMLIRSEEASSLLLI